MTHEPLPDSIELFAPETAEPHEYYDYVTPAWASKCPHEEIWVARLGPVYDAPNRSPET